MTIDLSRISFPVFFNEPTSMLQRMVRVLVEPTAFQTNGSQRQKIWNSLDVVSRYSNTISLKLTEFLSGCRDQGT